MRTDHFSFDSFHRFTQLRLGINRASRLDRIGLVVAVSFDEEMKS